MDRLRDAVVEYELTNAAGARVKFLNLGGIIRSIEVPDRSGIHANVVLGYENIAEYFGDDAYQGAIVGRYANRIANGRFNLDGVDYTLTRNDGHNTLHGGVEGFNKALWNIEILQEANGGRAILRHTGDDGDQGFPGTVDVTTIYTLTSMNELHVEFEGSTSKPTHVNLAQHSYFNLSGDFERTILDHELFIRAGRFTVVDRDLIPTGELRSVEATPFDFRQQTRIGSRIDTTDSQLEIGSGYDHNFVLDRDEARTLIHASTLFDPSTGRVMEIHTTEPGIQVYSGNHLHKHPKRSGIALETQHYPNSPNQPDFPSTVVRPGEWYRSHTEFRFKTL